LTESERTRKTPVFDADFALSEFNGGFLKALLVVLVIYLLARVLFRGGDPESVHWFLWILPLLTILVIPLVYVVSVAIYFIGGFSVTLPRRRWLKKAAPTTALIVDKRMRTETESYYDYSEDFDIPEVKLKYGPILATHNSGEQVLWAGIRHSEYEKHEIGDMVNIFYSIKDPILFLIEGE
jgi:hypothetical protein